MGSKISKKPVTPQQQQQPRKVEQPPRSVHSSSCMVIGMEAAKAPFIMAMEGRTLSQGMQFKSIQLELEETDSFMHGGRDSVRPMWRYMLGSTDCLVCVVDASNANELEMCKDEFHSILNANEQIKKKPTLIVCTNASAKGAMTTLQIARALELNPSTTTLVKSNQQKNAQTALLSTSVAKDSNVVGFTNNQIFDPALMPLVFDFVDETAAMAQYGKKGPDASQFMVVPLDSPSQELLHEAEAGVGDAATRSLATTKIKKFYQDALSESIGWLRVRSSELREANDKANGVNYTKDASSQLRLVSVPPRANKILSTLPRKHLVSVTGNDVENDYMVKYVNMQSSYTKAARGNRKDVAKQQQQQDTAPVIEKTPPLPLDQQPSVPITASE